MVNQLSEAFRKMLEQWLPTGTQVLSLPQACGHSLGRIRMTARAQMALESCEVTEALLRHLRGDDGDLEDFSAREPEQTALRDVRRLSVFRTAHGKRFWVITEADASLTTVLLPEEF